MTIRYDDIKKLISVGSYCVDVDLIYLPDMIKRYNEHYNLQMNPEFQRGHVWTESQQIKYVEYLIRGGNQNNIFLFNHPSWMGDKEGVMVLVDGLQRMTAILKFLNNELPVFEGNYLNDFEDKNFLYKIGIKVSVNNLTSYNEVLNWYIELNSGGTPHTDEEINKVKLLLINGEKNVT